MGMGMGAGAQYAGRIAYPLNWLGKAAPPHVSTELMVKGPRGLFGHYIADTVNKPGITGCLTPGGQMFHLRRGREVSGFEKLLLSGIPADQLLLGGEPEGQLSDLAGNAMSMPVVSACILSAFCIQSYAAANKNGKGGNGLEPPSKASKPSAASAPAASASAASAPSGSCEKFCFASCLGRAAHAERCSVLCTCESSGDVSKHAILRCSCCMMTLCGMCAAHVQLDSHNMQPLDAKGGRFGGSAEAADDPSAVAEEFEATIRSEVPDALKLETARREGAPLPAELACAPELAAKVSGLMGRSRAPAAQAPVQRLRPAGTGSCGAGGRTAAAPPESRGPR